MSQQLLKIRISYYLSHPIQYFSPLLREMAKEFDLQVYYYSDTSIRGNMDSGFGKEVKWDIPLLEGYSYHFLRNLSGRKSMNNRLWDAVNPAIISTLKRDKSSVVILNGWDYFSNLLLILSARLMGKQVWLRAENPLNQELRKRRITRKVKKLIFKFFLLPSVSKFLYIGKQSKQFFEYYGAKPSQLLFTPYAVDNGWFQKASAYFKNKEQVKQELGLPLSGKIILFTGKYIKKKRPLDIIKAFHLLKPDNITLIMVGEGILRKEMEDYLEEHTLNNVVLNGFVNQSEIPKYYSIADIFVMSSGEGETWGLSVNEAMNFGVPVIVSGTCGCAGDLVDDGTNGFVYAEGDINALKDRLQRLLADDGLRASFGQASLAKIEDFSISRIIQNMKEAFG